MEKEFLALHEFERSCGEIRMKNVVCDLDVTLLDIYHGREMEAAYEVITFDPKFNPTHLQKQCKNLLINSRILDNQTFTFKEEGNYYPMDIRSDLEVRFNILKPPGFDFEGRNLFLRQPLCLKEALLCSSIEVDNIDGSRERITLESIVSPSTVVRVEGRGFIQDAQFHYSSSKSALKRGDLFITFFIQFPDFLKHEQKEILKQILKEDPTAAV